MPKSFEVGDKVLAVSREATDASGYGFSRLSGLISEHVVMTVKEILDGEFIKTPFYTIHRDDLIKVYRPVGVSAS